MIATDAQVEKGIQQALARVKSPGVFVEGNSFSQFVETDYFVMVRQAGSNQIKRSARQAISKTTAIYLSEVNGEEYKAGIAWSPDEPPKTIPLFTPRELPELIKNLRALTSVMRRECV